ncbi:nucleoprotein [Mediterranean bat virus]|uniref:Nucleoprotein n=1 Tax=Mediterranean bat virus TaxID=2892035 RepID=A0AAE9C4A4_9RHAB|nr:nucleoprotein [Mediterranean bat virus]UED36862.1 nucleoprotein [Mediterranean bat virus]UED36877.1 nucleoprotein [Mediterranean bat virus]UED36882.1 nucleoprotein [Mediterranean bat virus]UED36887.1 nucleoprotein [Mediterranean bat virus]UED36892.1 nucleoprotein [Mediterranean bat virus]
MAGRIRDFVQKDEITVCAPSDVDLPEYPKDFFARGKKPQLVVGTRDTLGQLRGYVYSGLLDGTVLIQHVNSYLYLVLKEKKERNEKKWTSFGITIAEENMDINVFCMVDVKEEPSVGSDGKVHPDAIVDDDRWLPTYLLGLYRVGRATVPEYRALLMKNLMQQCLAMSPRAKPLVRDTDIFYDIWSVDRNYCKIVACTDMFYNRFKKSVDSGIRFGTIASRFKDCAALSTFSHLVRISGLTEHEVCYWVMLNDIRKEIRQMMMKGNEIDNPESYMPYLADFGISGKSPYSTVRNPCFHFWGQLTALLLRASRSKNARVPNDIPLSDLTTASWLFAYAIGRTADLQIQFGKIGDAAPPPMTVEADGPDPPTSKDPVEWLAWYVDNGKIPTLDMKRFGKAAVAALSELRVNTIGKYAKGYFDTC